MAAASNLRQRKKTSKKQNQQPKNDESATTAETTTPQQDEETLWHVFISHPLGYCLTRVLPFIAIPYGIYVLYLYVVLQHPEWVSKATFDSVQLRPAVAVGDARQVLVVGIMSSGTVQVAQELSKKLGLEIGHEDVDAQWNFVRDGTVSWFHGIRFMPAMQDNKEKLRIYRNICLEYSPNMGFHPRMYRPSNCSSHVKWNNCWARECMAILESEWNCNYAKSCETPFEYTLHQVRNPLRTIESLVAKFCQGGLDGTVQLPFTKLLEALFGITEELSCIEAAATYVVKYTNVLLKAHQDGLIQGMYKIEEATPCHVAGLAGLMDSKTTLYQPNYEKVVEICNPDTPNAAQQMMESTSHQINVDLVKLTWSDLEGGKHGSKRPEGSKEVEESVKDLFVKLGYDVENEMDATDPVFDF